MILFGYLKDDHATQEPADAGFIPATCCARAGRMLHFVDGARHHPRAEKHAALEWKRPSPGIPPCRGRRGRGGSVRDEEVMACVVLNKDIVLGKETAISIQDWCLERLAYFKAPGLVAFIDSLPVTSTNKVQKARLADFAVNPTNCFDLRDRKRRK